MNPRTLATFDELYEVDWFSNVGVADVEDTVVLSSWKEAAASCASDRWNRVLEETANRLRVNILKVSKAEYRKWNDLVDMIKPLSNALVYEKINKIVERDRIPKEVIDVVMWDILHLGMECEYSNIVQPNSMPVNLTGIKLDISLVVYLIITK